MVEGTPVGYGVLCESGVDNTISGASNGDVEGVRDWMACCNPPVAVDSVPFRTTVSWRVMVMAVSVKSALQPWSQIWAMGMRKLDARFGKMCAWWADFGRPGIRRVSVCVLVTIAPFGREIWILLLLEIGVTSSRSWDTLKKIPVAPVSIIIGGEGPDCVDLI
jgi:hypothetical protein